MKIDRACFAKLLDFVEQFPRYFVGSNAGPAHRGWLDSRPRPLQGGHFGFAMARAGMERRYRSLDSTTSGWNRSLADVRCTPGQF